MRDRRILVVAVVAMALTWGASGCGSDGTGGVASGSDGDGDGTVTETTVFPAGDSGMFVVEPVPEGWGIDRAYSPPDGSAGVSYVKGGDDDNGYFSVNTFPVDPADPNTVRMREMLDLGGTGITRIELHGHDAYLMALVDDGRTYGDQIQWFERPDLVVSVRIPWDSGLDATTVARDAHEISTAARDALVIGASGGGEAGPPVEALRGTVDGDEWVLSAVLPTDYPLEPVDQRRGCATLTYRGESASSCRQGFTTLDEGRQAVLGGVAFGFGVVAEPSGEVEILQPENTSTPPHPTDAIVLPQAPALTWFVTAFSDVCDRFGVTSAGQSFIVGVPAGYPHRNDCAA